MPFQAGILFWHSVLSLAVFSHGNVGHEMPQAQSTVTNFDLVPSRRPDPVLLLWKCVVPKALSLMLTDVIQEILGTTKCRMSWNLVLESLGRPVINRYMDYSLIILIAFAVGPVSYCQGFAMRFTLPASWHRTYLANYHRLILSKGIWLAYYEGACLGPRCGW